MNIALAEAPQPAATHQQRIRYRPTPTMALLHRSRAKVRGILGPVGSGKSVGCVMEVWRIAYQQAPDAQKVRRSRVAIVRNTYGELKQTTIKTWQQWVPEEICPIVYDSPIRGLLRAPHPDGVTTVECEVLFVALDKPKDVKKLLSLELTAAWINEAREIPFAIVLALRQRIGRYPAKVVAPLTQASLLMDTNPPDSDHWWYSLAVDRRTPGGDEDAPLIDDRDWFFVQQPPALIRIARGRYLPNPDAENVENQPLGYDYWTDQVSGATEEWIKVYLLGQYGYVQEGKPVYPEYRDDIHASKTDLKPIPGLPLLLGWDFGLTPACIVGQLTPRGTLRVIDEFCADGMGIRQFAEQVVRPQLAVRYPGWSLDDDIIGAGDPAGADPAQTDETTCFQVLTDLGFRMVPAWTNAFLPRREAVASFMTRMDVGEPSFMLSPRCRKVRKGMLGGYHYRRVQVPGKLIYRDEPDKDEFSHPQDGLQYLALFATKGDHRSDAAIRKTMPDPRRRIRGMVA